MSLSQALSTALAGLNATQANLSIISGNISNANTPGYVRETADQVEVGTGPFTGTSVQVTSINRELDTLLQSQLRTETSGGGYADLSAKLYQQLQQIYGTPGSAGTLSAAYGSFTSALQGLATSPSSYSAQSGVLGAAQSLTQSLGSLTTGIQGLRTQAEQGIANDVQQANADMQTIAQINTELGASRQKDSTTATLQDQRDQAISDLAKLMDIKTVTNTNNQVAVFTGTGLQLVGDQAAQLTFDNRGTLTATTLWSANPAQRGVGTLTLVSASGGKTDLIADGVIQSGELAAYVKMRDTILPQAQNQIDAVAQKVSQALSDQPLNVSAATLGSQKGFSADIGGILPGNSFQITFTDSASVQHTATVVRVDDPAALPLPNPDPSNPLIGVNFSAGTASVVSQLNLALGSNLQFANSGTVLTVLNNSSSGAVVNSLSGAATVTSLQSGSPQLPLFLDGTTPITGTITSTGSQIVGLAGRIAVNPALSTNPGNLVTFASSTTSGDPTRPNFMLSQLTKASFSFSPSTGIGGQNAPFTGTLTNFMSQIVSQQSLAANAATNLQQGQDTVVGALQQRLNSQSGVSIDTEMTNLINLQNAYAANARVMTTIQQMMATLLQIGA
jgi:flagellar hook-associated protein 1 FlgK